MLIVDVETSGTEPEKHSIISIGAVRYEKPEDTFYAECKIWEGAHIMEEALLVNGFSEAQIKDQSKKEEGEIVKEFLDWAGEDHMIAGHNPSFDRDFLRHGAMRAHIDWPFAHRTIDSHSVCWTHMVLSKITPPLKNNRSALNLDAILRYVGLPEEPKPHNALTGAKLEAEAFARLLESKSILEEFGRYELPWGKRKA